MSELVSVVVPTRNRASLLSRTIASVLAQQDVDLEIVVVDDGSTGGDAREVRAMSQGPIRVVVNPVSLGVAAARNRGIAEARGRWVAFLDDDDLWSPHKLRAQLDAMATAGAHWSYAGAVKFIEGPVVWRVMPAPTPERVVEVLASKCLVPAGASNVVASTDVVRRIGGFDENLMHMADWDMWLRLLETGSPAAAPVFGVGYRQHPHAMSLQPDGVLGELREIDRRWRHLRGGGPLVAGPTHLWIARSWLRAGRRGRAAISFARAIPTKPRQGLRGLARVLYPPPPGPARDVLTVTWPAMGTPSDTGTTPDGFALERALQKWGAPSVPTRGDADG